MTRFCIVSLKQLRECAQTEKLPPGKFSFSELSERMAPFESVAPSREARYFIECLPPEFSCAAALKYKVLAGKRATHFLLVWRGEPSVHI